MNKKILIVGGLNSFGVPYTRDNKERINHLSIVKNVLEERRYEVNVIDMYSMSKYNTTDYLEYIIDNKVNLREIRANQRESIKICKKKGFFQFVQLPMKTINLYPDLKEEEKIIVSEEITNNQSIFIYSCGVNDFLKDINSDLGKMLRPKNMEEAFLELEVKIFIVIDKIKNNFEKLIKLNPNIKICILGVYIPTRANYIRKRVCQPINLFNENLKKISYLYKNVIYVDNSNLSIKEMASFDWHPNKNGQTLIGQNIIKEIKKTLEL